MSTEQPHQLEQSAPPRLARSWTTAQAAAWEKVERDRAEAAARQGTTPVHPVAVARLVIGVLLAAAAVTTYFAMAPEEPYEEARASSGSTVEYLDLLSVQQEQADDRRDALLMIGLVGVGAAIATSGAERRTVGRPS